MIRSEKLRHILDHHSDRSNGFRATEHLKGEVVPGVVCPASAQRRESLARWAADHNVGPDAGPADHRGIFLQRFGIPKVEAVGLDAFAIRLYGKDGASSNAVQPETEASRTGEEVDVREH